MNAPAPVAYFRPARTVVVTAAEILQLLEAARASGPKKIWLGNDDTCRVISRTDCVEPQRNAGGAA